MLSDLRILEEQKMADDGAGSKTINQKKKSKSNFNITKLFGMKQSEEAEDEILEIVYEAQQTGLINEDTKNLIENVFEFADTTAGDIMTHRTEITAIEDSEDLEKMVALAIESGRSRIPVYHEDLDNIVGAVYAKDLLKFVCSNSSPKVKLTDIIRPVLYVPVSSLCGEIGRAHV